MTKWRNWIHVFTGMTNRVGNTFAVAEIT